MSNAIEDNAEVRLILLLGSYDKKTKEILYKIKDEIAKISTFYKDFIFALLLENVEMYIQNDKTSRDFLVEFYDNRASIMIFKYGVLEDIVDIDAKTVEEVEDYIMRNFGNVEKVPILMKLSILASHSFLILLIRHVEETRCGEYIELVFLTRGKTYVDKIYLLINKNIEISTMLKELIEAARINLRYYKDENELLETIRKIIYYRIYNIEEFGK